MCKVEVDVIVVSVVQGNMLLLEKLIRQVWSDVLLLFIVILCKFDLDVVLNFGWLIVEKLLIDDVSLKLCGQGGVISFDDMCGGLYNGCFNVKVNFDVCQDSVVLIVIKYIVNVLVECLFEVQGKKLLVKGLFDFDVDICISGNSEKFWIDYFNGNVCFSLINGVLFDVNLE